MPSLREAVAVNLQKFMKEKGISQTDLAKLLGVTFQTVNAYANARRGISSDTISKLARVFDVEETDFTSLQKPKSAVPAEIQKAIEEGIKRGLEQGKLTSPAIPPEIQEIVLRGMKNTQNRTPIQEPIQGKEKGHLQDISAKPLVERVQAKVAQLERIRLENLEMLIDKQLERQRAKKGSSKSDVG